MGANRLAVVNREKIGSRTQGSRAARGMTAQARRSRADSVAGGRRSGNCVDSRWKRPVLPPDCGPLHRQATWIRIWCHTWTGCRPSIWKSWAVGDCTFGEDGRPRRGRDADAAGGWCWSGVKQESRWPRLPAALRGRAVSRHGACASGPAGRATC